MPGLLDYVIGIVSFLLEIGVVVFAFYCKPRFSLCPPWFLYALHRYCSNGSLDLC